MEQCREALNALPPRSKYDRCSTRDDAHDDDAMTLRLAFVCAVFDAVALVKHASSNASNARSIRRSHDARRMLNDGADRRQDGDRLLDRWTV
jgi:hypothetical protein